MKADCQKQADLNSIRIPLGYVMPILNIWSRRMHSFLRFLSLHTKKHKNMIDFYGIDCNLI
jgi:hypothetical protein